MQDRFRFYHAAFSNPRPDASRIEDSGLEVAFVETDHLIGTVAV